MRDTDRENGIHAESIILMRGDGEIPPSNSPDYAVTFFIAFFACKLCQIQHLLWMRKSVQKIIKIPACIS